MNVNSYFAIGDVINFTVYPTAVLGTNFNRVKVLAVLDADTAKQYIDVIAMHANIYPTLPNPDKVTYKKYTDYLYIKVQLSNGTVTALGLPWINMSTVVKVTAQVANFAVAISAPGDIDVILALLRANGFYSIEVTT